MKAMEFSKKEVSKMRYLRSVLEFMCISQLCLFFLWWLMTPKITSRLLRDTWTWKLSTLFKCTFWEQEKFKRWIFKLAIKWSNLNYTLTTPTSILASTLVVFVELLLGAEAWTRLPFNGASHAMRYFTSGASHREDRKVAGVVPILLCSI
jgi:hypothetical protein